MPHAPSLPFIISPQDASMPAFILPSFIMLPHEASGALASVAVVSAGFASSAFLPAQAASGILAWASSIFMFAPHFISASATCI